MPLSVDKLVGYWQAQKAIADVNDLGLIQYEAENHNDPPFFSGLTVAERARFMEFYKQCNHTNQDAKNCSEMFNNFIAVGGKYPSKFVEIGAVSAWGGLRYLGDRNPVWDAVVAFNGRG